MVYDGQSDKIYKSDVFENEQSTSVYNERTTFTSENRFYNGNTFWGLGLNSELNGSISKTKNTYSNFDDKTQNANIHIAIPLSVGFGRIERVEDARLAVYILNDLATSGKLGHEPTNDEILEFAKFISELKNERFFDYRHKKIYELQRVDSFLRATNILN